MIKQIAIFSLSLFMVLPVKAQEFTIDYFGSEADNSSSGDNSSRDNYREEGDDIVIVPFDTKLYFNDAHRNFTDSSGLTNEQVIVFLREQLDQYLIKALDDTASSRSILSSSTLSSSTPMSRIYYLLSYQMADATAHKSWHSRFFPSSKLSEGDRENERNEGSRDGEVVSPVRDRTKQYVNVIVQDNEVFDYLDEGGPARGYLFINQFEIKGDYSDPYKTANKENENLIRVHFSVFDYSGDFVYGNYAAVAYPAYVSDPETLARDYFGPLCKQIIRSIPFSKL